MEGERDPLEPPRRTWASRAAGDQQAPVNGADEWAPDREIVATGSQREGRQIPEIDADAYNGSEYNREIGRGGDSAFLHDPSFPEEVEAETRLAQFAESSGLGETHVANLSPILGSDTDDSIFKAYVHSLSNGNAAQSGTDNGIDDGNGIGAGSIGHGFALNAAEDALRINRSRQERYAKDAFAANNAGGNDGVGSEYLTLGGDTSLPPALPPVSADRPADVSAGLQQTTFVPVSDAPPQGTSPSLIKPVPPFALKVASPKFSAPKTRPKPPAPQPVPMPHFFPPSPPADESGWLPVVGAAAGGVGFAGSIAALIMYLRRDRDAGASGNVTHKYMNRTARRFYGLKMSSLNSASLNSASLNSSSQHYSPSISSAGSAASLASRYSFSTTGSSQFPSHTFPVSESSRALSGLLAPPPSASEGLTARRLRALGEESTRRQRTVLRSTWRATGRHGVHEMETSGYALPTLHPSQFKDGQFKDGQVQGLKSRATFGSPSHDSYGGPSHGSHGSHEIASSYSVSERHPHPRSPHDPQNWSLSGEVPLPDISMPSPRTGGPVKSREERTLPGASMSIQTEALATWSPAASSYACMLDTLPPKDRETALAILKREQRNRAERGREANREKTSPTIPSSPTHPTYPTHPSCPANAAQITQTTLPTHPAHLTHTTHTLSPPAHSAHPAHPAHPITAEPCHTFTATMDPSYPTASPVMLYPLSPTGVVVAPSLSATQATCPGISVANPHGHAGCVHVGCAPASRREGNAVSCAGPKSPRSRTIHHIRS